MKVMSFFLNYNYNYKEIYIYHGYIIRKFIIFLQVSFSVYSFFPPPLCQMLSVGQGKLFSEASKLFMHAAFQLVVVHKMAFLESTFRRLKRWKLENAKSGM